jgi:hypothetical protein
MRERGRIGALSALGALALLGLGLSACGSEHTGPASTAGASSRPAAAPAHATPPGRAGSGAKVDAASKAARHGARRPADADADGDGRGRFDGDDRSTLDFGHAAGAAEARAIAALVRRYIAAEAAEDGARACALNYSIYAESLVEDFGASPGTPAYAKGTTCASVLTKVFEHFHAQLLAESRHLKVVRVRLKQRQGIVVLTFASSSLPPREIHVLREGRTWRAEALVDSPLQ